MKAAIIDWTKELLHWRRPQPRRPRPSAKRHAISFLGWADHDTGIVDTGTHSYPAFSIPSAPNTNVEYYYLDEDLLSPIERGGWSREEVEGFAKASLVFPPALRTCMCGRSSPSRSASYSGSMPTQIVIERNDKEAQRRRHRVFWRPAFAMVHENG